jgi:hypothetical protein
MPKLACRACGRQVYTTASIESLFAEERRCPRCGAVMDAERRTHERREVVRRGDPSPDPGPPPETGERRSAERRVAQRRQRDAGG